MVVAVVVFLVYFAPVIMSLVQNSSSQSSNSNTKLTVQAWSYGLYDLDTNKWQFSYHPAGTEAGISIPAHVWITDIAGNTLDFDVTVGTSRTWDGLEISVSEMYPAYIVFLIRRVS